MKVTLTFPNVTEKDLGLYQLKVAISGEKIESNPIAFRVVGKNGVFKFQQQKGSVFTS